MGGELAVETKRGKLEAPSSSCPVFRLARSVLLRLDSKHVRVGKASKGPLQRRESGKETEGGEK